MQYSKVENTRYLSESSISLKLGARFRLFNHKCPWLIRWYRTIKTFTPIPQQCRAKELFSLRKSYTNCDRIMCSHTNLLFKQNVTHLSFDVFLVTKVCRSIMTLLITNFVPPVASKVWFFVFCHYRVYTKSNE